MDTLHMGAVVTVYSRQLKIVEYGDSHTEAAFHSPGNKLCASSSPAPFTSRAR